MDGIQKFLFHDIPQKKTRATERGELLKWISGKVQRKIPQVATRLAKLEIKDLYYIKAYMEDLERNGKHAVKWFWWATKPENEYTGFPQGQ